MFFAGVDLIINRVRDSAAFCFFGLVGIAVGMVFAGSYLSGHSGMLIIPVRRVCLFHSLCYATYCFLTFFIFVLFCLIVWRCSFC
jgi:hypothetical protein